MCTTIAYVGRYVRVCSRKLAKEEEEEEKRETFFRYRKNGVLFLYVKVVLVCRGYYFFAEKADSVEFCVVVCF